MNKSYRNAIAFLVGCSILWGCGTTNRSVQLSQSNLGRSDGASSVKVGFFSKSVFHPGAYALMEKRGGEWLITSISRVRPQVFGDGHEVVMIDRTGTLIQPAYDETFSQFNRQGELLWFDCSEVLSGLILRIL